MSGSQPRPRSHARTCEFVPGEFSLAVVYSNAKAAKRSSLWVSFQPVVSADTSHHANANSAARYHRAYAHAHVYAYSTTGTSIVDVPARLCTVLSHLCAVLSHLCAVLSPRCGRVAAPPLAADRLYLTVSDAVPKGTASTYYFSSDELFRYHNFYQDFGPLNMAHLVLSGEVNFSIHFVCLLSSMPTVRYAPLCPRYGVVQVTYFIFLVGTAVAAWWWW
jgi:hypothetical protein